MPDKIPNAQDLFRGLPTCVMLVELTTAAFESLNQAYKYGKRTGQYDLSLEQWGGAMTCKGYNDTLLENTDTHSQVQADTEFVAFISSKIEEISRALELIQTHAKTVDNDMQILVYETRLAVYNSVLTKFVSRGRL
jgi:hypothetical protein